MSKRLLFIEDLYDFYSNTYKRSTRFDASKTGSPIVVQVHGKVNFEETNKDTEGLLPVHLQACHTNLNINGSNISESVMTSALPSFSNRPILGYIHNVNGQDEFYSHNIHEDKDGNIVYDEVPVGIVPESCNAQLVYDEEKGKTYCEVDGYIFEEYSKAAEILQREGECSVSVELSIRSLSYNAKEKYLDIEDFFFSGVTILGKTPNGDTVMPGMEKSNIKLADFSEKNNSLFAKYENQLIEFQARLEKLESTCANTYYSKEGGNETNMFEKLLEKYGKTVEDITFDYAELSDEELESKFAEMFKEAETGTDGSGNEPSNNGEGDGSADPEDNTNTGDDGEGSNTGNNDGEGNEQFEKLVRTFEISHEDTRYALYNLLSAYEESDNEWYWITNVYDSYFVYENWDSTKIYRQDYSKDGDNIAFENERIELFKELLTASEKAELDAMRSNYAALKEFKENVEKNELTAQKNELINSEKYTVITEKNEAGEYKNEAFAKLVSEMDNYSLSELETQIKVIHSDFMAENSNFSTKPESKIGSVKVFANPNKKAKPKKRYGNLFD